VPYLKAVHRVATLYNLLNHDPSEEEKGVVEIIQIDKQGNLFQKTDLTNVEQLYNEVFEQNMQKSRDDFYTLGMKESKPENIEETKKG